MKLKYGSIIDFSTIHYPEKIASVVYLAGNPFKKEAFEEVFTEADTSYFLNHFKMLSEQVDAIVFTGVEPLQQANALRELCQALKQHAFLVRVDTCGYFPEELRELLPFLDVVSMEVKTRFEKEAYADILGFAGEKDLLLSNVLRSIAFLESFNTLYKEFRTTIIPGKNDLQEIISSIAQQVSFADKYVIQQFSPLTSKQQLIELASSAKQFIASVSIKTLEGEEEVV